MGQSSSSESDDENVFNWLSEDFVTLSYEKFLQILGDLNKLSKDRVDSDGNRLVFAVKKGSDSSVLWKATVQIACVKVHSDLKKVASFRLLNLVEFLKVVRTFKDQVAAEQDSKKCMELVDVSMILKNQELSNKECCICLERKHEVILPCLHSYCKTCIEEWNSEHLNCPICRETLESSDDVWVISEIPEADEISKEIQENLMGLTESRD